MSELEVPIRWRRATAATATTNNVVLGAGEAGFETDTGKWKLGDGATAWNDLGYQPGPADLDGLASEQYVDSVASDVTANADAHLAPVDSFGAGVAPLTDVDLDANSRPPRGYFDGWLFATSSAGRVLNRSGDEGVTWQVVQDFTSWIDGDQIRGVRKLGDGEVAVSIGTHILKSDGWTSDPAAASWSVKLGPLVDLVLEWGFKTYPDHGVVAVAQYGSDYANTKAWVSYDNADTFTEVYTTVPNEHLHAIEWDPHHYAETGVSRLYLAKHNGPGGQGDPAVSGTWFTDDDGVDWRLVRFVDRWAAAREPDATVIHAHRDGIILGSDYWPNGVWRIPRVPADDRRFRVYPILTWDPTQGLSGVARGSFEVDGIVYLTYAHTNDPARLVACDGRRAWLVYTEDHGGAAYTWRHAVVSDAHVFVDRGSRLFKAPRPAELVDLAWHQRPQAPDGRRLLFEGEAPTGVEAVTLTARQFGGVNGSHGGAPHLTEGTRPREVWRLTEELTTSIQAGGERPDEWPSCDIDVHVVNLGPGSGDFRLLLRYSDADDDADMDGGQDFVPGGVHTAKGQGVVQVVTVADVPLPSLFNIAIERQGQHETDTLENWIGVERVRIRQQATS